MVTDDRRSPVVLVADDDDLVRLVVRRALERAGYVVVVASSGDDVPGALTATPIDLAIVDAHMPGPSLAETLRVLRATSGDLPLLVISGDAAPPTDPALPEFHFLCKPVELETLLATVDGLIDRSGAADE